MGLGNRPAPRISAIARRAPPEENLRARGLIHEAEQFADGLRLIALGMTVLEIKQSGGVTACAVEISKTRCAQDHPAHGEVNSRL